MKDIRLIRATAVESSDAVTMLFSQLNDRGYTPDYGRINSLIEAGSLAFYMAIQDGTPVGMASVIPCRTAAHDKLWIEDVCVLEGWRCRGIGRALLEFAMKDAADLFGSGTFWLTSRPSRAAAHHLYASLGFNRKDTGVFIK